MLSSKQSINPNQWPDVILASSIIRIKRVLLRLHQLFNDSKMKNELSWLAKLSCGQMNRPLNIQVNLVRMTVARNFAAYFTLLKPFLVGSTTTVTSAMQVMILYQVCVCHQNYSTNFRKIGSRHRSRHIKSEYNMIWILNAGNIKSVYITAHKLIRWWGAGLVICLQLAANDLHMVQLMPLPPRNILLQQNPEWFILLVSAYPGYPGKKAVKRLRVCVLQHINCREIRCYKKAKYVYTISLQNDINSGIFVSGISHCTWHSECFLTITDLHSEATHNNDTDLYTSAPTFRRLHACNKPE